MSNPNRTVHKPSTESAHVPKTLQVAKEEFKKADEARMSQRKEYERPFSAAEAKKQEIDTKLRVKRKAFQELEQEIKQLEKEHEIQKEIHAKQYDDGFNTAKLLQRCIDLRKDVREERSSVENVLRWTKEMEDIGRELAAMTNNMKNYLKTVHRQQ